MQAIAEYIKMLAVFMVFSALVDIMSPSSSFKKYLNLILGLMLIAFMLEPLADLIYNTNGFLSQAYNKYAHIADTRELREINEEMGQKNANAITAEYKKRLIGQITALVEERADVLECRVIVNEDYKSPKFAEIYGIHLTAQTNYEEPESGAVKDIAFGRQSAQISAEAVKENTETIVKKCLMDFYNIDEGNIHITVH